MSVMHSMSTICYLCPLTTFGGKSINEVSLDSDKFVPRKGFYKTFVPVEPHLSVIPDNPLYEPINIHPQLPKASYVSLVKFPMEAKYVVENLKESHNVEEEDFKRLKQLESFKRRS